MILNINNVYDYEKLNNYDHNGINKGFALILQISNLYYKKAILY